jgi:hypothetical protein
MEASRRIELLYTDLPSVGIGNENKGFALEKYQDIRRTGGEPDTP